VAVVVATTHARPLSTPLNQSRRYSQAPWTGFRYAPALTSPDPTSASRIEAALCVREDWCCCQGQGEEGGFSGNKGTLLSPRRAPTTARTPTHTHTRAPQGAKQDESLAVLIENLQQPGRHTAHGAPKHEVASTVCQG
jgi:hypothetical protein